MEIYLVTYLARCFSHRCITKALESKANRWFENENEQLTWLFKYLKTHRLSLDQRKQSQLGYQERRMLKADWTKDKKNQVTTWPSKLNQKIYLVVTNSICLAQNWSQTAHIAFHNPKCKFYKSFLVEKIGHWRLPCCTYCHLVRVCSFTMQLW